MVKKAPKQDTGTISFALKNFWVDYVGWGRARRSEYWWVILFYEWVFPFVVSFVLNFMAGFAAAVFGGYDNAISVLFTGADVLISGLWTLVLMVGCFCLVARRLHDTNRSNWNVLWVLLPIIGWIVLLVYLCQPGDKKANRFGAPRM
ncbi:MAG: DUF805 domain-containing protein [Alphaproteobacteria bacterium]|nr:DUF805 domain-containing protein [Alphaproteobacteria bacterium]